MRLKQLWITIMRKKKTSEQTTVAVRETPCWSWESLGILLRMQVWKMVIFEVLSCYLLCLLASQLKSFPCLNISSLRFIGLSCGKCSELGFSYPTDPKHGGYSWTLPVVLLHPIWTPSVPMSITTSFKFNLEIKPWAFGVGAMTPRL